jgi:hypothetical protein
MGPMRAGDTVAVLECSHGACFHDRCLARWLLRKVCARARAG